MQSMQSNSGQLPPSGPSGQYHNGGEATHDMSMSMSVSMNGMNGGGGAGMDGDPASSSSSLGSPQGPFNGFIRRRRLPKRAPDHGWGSRPPPPFLPYSPSVVVHLPKSITSIQPAMPIAPLFSNRLERNPSSTHRHRPRRCDKRALNDIRNSYVRRQFVQRQFKDNELF